MSAPSKHWKELVLDKQRRQAQSIPNEWLIDLPPQTVLDVTTVPGDCGLFSPKELEITNTVDIDILLSKLASAEWSAVETTTAFYKRAIVAQQLTSCLTEVFVEKALARATMLDNHLKETGQPIGPLHGLPISLKDQLSISGLETTLGFASWVGKYADKNAVLVDILYALGAVPFVRTNVPQTLMWAETYNAIFGRTLNPWNISLTSGGSSGGEGALIAMKGSPLGVGSDIGGSIRIPSAFCGLYGLRPSSHRVPYARAANTMDGQNGVPSVLGPMSNSLTGIRTFMRAVLGAQPWKQDPLALRLPWNEAAYKLSEHGSGGKLCFGIMWHDHAVMPHPPILRALEMAKQALLAAGHEVIDWKPHKHHEMRKVLVDIWNAGQDEDYAAIVSESQEPILASLEIGRENEAQTLEKGKSTHELWQLHKKQRTLREEYLAAWNASVNRTTTGRPIDAIISPVLAYTATPHGKYHAATYTMIWNVLDYPALTIPVTRVDPQFDVKRAPHDFMTSSDKTNYEEYDPAIFANAPVGIQLVGQTQEDEALIGMGEVLDAALKAYQEAGKPSKL